MTISVALYLPNFAAGGAERLNINLGAELTRRGFDVVFVVHKREGALLPVLPDGIRVVSLDAGRTLGAFWPLVKYLRCERPNILLSSLGHNNIIAIWARLLARVKTRIIVSQHNSLEYESKTDAWKGRVLPLLYQLSLPFADGIVAVSGGVANELAAMTGTARSRITVIYNAVVGDDFPQRLSEQVAHPWLNDNDAPIVLGAGRLVAQKDFATLLEAFALVVQKQPARLMILGDGELRKSLLDQAERLGIAGKVDFVGFVLNPLPFMKRARVFVLSSRFEGFGNVLVEALACGTPIISTSCHHGPDEIIEGGRFGRLVPVGDAHAMAHAISEVLREEPNRDALRARGNSFTLAQAGAAYEHLFYKLHFGREPFSPAGAVDY